MNRPTCFKCSNRIGALDALLFRLGHSGQRTLRCWPCRSGRRVWCPFGRHYGRGPLVTWHDADDERLPAVTSCRDCRERGNAY